MDDKDLVQGKIGSVGSYDVMISGNKLVAKSTVSEGPFSAEASVSVEAKALLDAIAAKIGGAIPAEIASFLEAAFKL